MIEQASTCMDTPDTNAHMPHTQNVEHFMDLHFFPVQAQLISASFQV